MPDSIDYEIHSLHINVGNGDGAIHLLVEPNGDTANKKNLVHRAILVDGGKTTAVDQVLKTIKYVEDTYSIVDLNSESSKTILQPPQLMFDGIVISRWAVDHSAGVLELINQDLLTGQPDTAKARKSADGKTTLGPCSFMRYTTDATPAPLTNLYSAFWDGPTGASLVAEISQASSKQPPPTSQIKITPPSASAPAPKFTAGDVNRTVDFVDSSVQTKIWSKVCNLVATPVELIGRELFTGQIEAATSATTVRNYVDLKAMTDAISALPVKYQSGNALTGICCIGADGTTVSAKDATAVTDTSTILKASSITLVAVVGGVVKHYFAGDSDYRDDDVAAAWIATSVPVVKLGNHGSVVSAPVELVQKLSPSHFICSMGPSITQLHPRWELLMYLKAWADSGGDTPKVKGPFFHPTCYPVFFTTAVSPKLQFDFDPFSTEISTTSADSAIKRFQNAVNTLDSTLVKTIKDHADKLPDEASKTKWAIDFLRNSWPFMSYSIPEQHPIAGSVGPGNVAVSQETQILFIMAQLTKTDTVISYVNGGRKTVSKSSDPTPDPAKLDTFMGYNPPQGAGARKIPWFTADADREDTAAGGVVLQKPDPFKAIGITDWTDEDDETPTANFIDLIPDGAFPEATAVTEDKSTASTTDTPPLYFLGVPAYDKGTKGSDTEIVVKADINNFISGLGPGFIGSDKDKPLSTARDIWGYYMNVGLLKTTITLTSTDTGISGASMVCNLFDKALNFSTANNEAQFNNKEYHDAGADISNKNVAIPDHAAIVCGLDPKADLDSLSLTDLLTKFNFKFGNDDSTLSKLVLKLGKVLQMKLLPCDPSWVADPDPGKVTAPVYRNAIWCIADTLFRFTIRLSFQIDQTSGNSYVDKVASFLNDYLGISGITAKLSSAAAAIRFEVEMTGKYHPTFNYGFRVVTESVLRAIFPVNIPISNGTSSLDLTITLTFSGSGIGIDINTQNLDASKLLLAGAGLTGDETIENAAQSLIDCDIFGLTSLSPHNIWISRESGKTEYGVTFYFNAFDKVPVGLSYNSAGIFTGALLLTSSMDNSQKLLPEYDIDMDPKSISINNPQPLEITSLFGAGCPSLPNGLPAEISEAWIEYTKLGAGQNKIRVFGTITSSTTTNTETLPVVDIQSVSLQAERTVKSATEKEVNVTLSTTIQMNAVDGSKIPPATLNASLNFEDGDWIFHGRLESFQFTILSSHFPPEFAHAFDDVLGKFLVRFVDITYTYDKPTAPETKTVASFLISGAIDFGGLELGLAYQYISSKVPPNTKSATELVQETSETDVVPPGQKPLPAPADGNDPEWKFDAWLGAVPGTNATVGSVLDSIDSSISSVLPDFVTSTPIPGADDPSPPISIEVTTLEKPDKGLAFRAWVKLGDISLTFIQRSTRVSSTTPGAPAPPQADPSRILRISVATLPTAQKIPLVNELPQPFDTLEYMWVSSPQPGTAGKENTAGGFTQAQVDELNTKVLGNGYPPILTKPLKSDAPKAGNADGPAAAAAEIVLLSGHHFRVIHNGEVILDYPFGQKQFPVPETKGTETKATETKTTLISTAPKKALVADDAGPDEAPESKGAIGKTIGPLTISNVGVKLDDGFVWLSLDAILALGPLSFDLIGFGVGFDLKKANKGLSAASIEGLAASLQIQLHGMGLGFERPPITIAGVFMHDDVGGVNSYSGGVAVGFPPYTLVAVGEYDEVTPPSGSPYKSVFVFAKLDGPLVELEFATIEGVRLGFGFNNIVVTPDLANLTSFPFISDSAYAGTGNDPMKVLAKIHESIQLQDGALWLAAGMTITAFDILSITAVALVEFSKAGCDISLFCDGMASMPPDAGPDLSIVYVEVVMIIEMNISQGFFRCEAALAPTSFILVPQCHLLGGFALCYWFPPSEHAGDFVFTIGGYHRSYTPPPHYPVPQRIGFACKMGDDLSVSGEAYFAITPTCCMGGGHLHVQIDVGPVSAYLDAFCDFLITYKPFHYIADMGVDVGVTFDADWWIIHIHISCHVGADLHIEGPEFGGSAHVDFYLFGFTVYFGASPEPPPPLKLENEGSTNGFYQICKQPGPGAPPPSGQDNSADPEMTNLHVTLEAGAYTQGSNKTAGSNDASNPPTNPTTKWKVRAGSFRFRITCDFSISSYTINNEPAVLAYDSTSTKPQPAEAPIYAFPMHVTQAITSSLNITILNQEVAASVLDDATHPKPTDPSLDGIPTPLGITPALTPSQITKIGNFDIEPYKPSFIIKSVPKALWGPYSQSLDPMAPNGGGGLLNGSGTTPTVDLAMGVSIGAPDPTLSKDKIDFAFNALEAMRANVFGSDLEDPSIAAPLPAQSSWLPQPVKDPNTAEGWVELKADWGQSTDLAGLLTGCMNALGWDKPPPEAVAALGASGVVGTARLPWELNAESPDVLKAGLGGYYLSLPQIAGAA